MVDEFDLALSAGPARTVCSRSCTPPLPVIFAAGADIAEMVDRDADAAHCAESMRGSSTGSRRIRGRASPSSTARPTAAAANWRWPATCGSRHLEARFAQPELGLGILAGAGANWRLPQTAGLPIARRMLYVGEVLSAEQALTAGLVDACILPKACWARRPRWPNGWPADPGRRWS